jgi:predicted kinase
VSHTNLVVFAGPSGVGKSTLAATVATELQIPLLPVDTIEVAIARAGIEGRQVARPAAYAATAQLAALHLDLGMSVIADVNAAIPATREFWPDLAMTTGARMRVIEISCVDRELLRSRLAVRKRDIPEPSWDQVVSEHDSYVPWDQATLRIDSATSPDINVQVIIGHLRET